MFDKTALGISEELRQYIEALVEEVVLEGKPFENQKKYLQRFCQTEGIDYNQLETNLTTLFETAEELKVHESKGSERLLRLLAKECFISLELINKIVSRINDIGDKIKPNPEKNLLWKKDGYVFEDGLFSYTISNSSCNWVYIKGNSTVYPATLHIPEIVRHKGEDFKVVGVGINGVGFQEASFNEVILPDSILEIGDCAFASCKSLSKIVIPPSVTKIGSAFGNCLSLKSIALPPDLACIPASCFIGCGLTEITFNEKLVEIGNNAFLNCCFRHVVIPDSVAIIGVSAFAQNYDLESVVLPHHLKDLSVHSFAGCSKLKQVEMPSSLNSIGERCFDSCDLESIIIPDGVSVIADAAFNHNKHLSLGNNGIWHAPSSLHHIGRWAFLGCEKIKEVYIDGWTFLYGGTETSFPETTKIIRN